MRAALVVLLLFVAGCSAPEDAAPTPTGPVTSTHPSPVFPTPIATTAASPTPVASPAPTTTPSPSPAPAPTPTSTPSPAPTSGSTPTPTVAPEPTPTPTPTATPTPAPSPTPTPTPTPVTPTPTPSPTPTPTPPPPPPPPAFNASAPYLAALRVCASGSACNASSHEIRLASSQDGASFTLMPNATPASGGVPELVRRGDTLYLYANNTLHRYSLASGTWGAPVPVQVTNASGGAALVANASAIVDGDGRMTLFYLVGRTTGDAWSCASIICTKTIRSATEVTGSDGSSFAVDAGDRALLSTNTTATDPDVYAGPGGFVLLSGFGGSSRANEAAELRGTYSFASLVSNGTGNFPAGHYHAPTGKHWIYVARSIDGAPPVIRRAIVEGIGAPAPASSFVTVGFAGLPPGAGVDSLSFLDNRP